MSEVKPQALENKARIRKHNPGTFQSHEEVKELFVVRNNELNVVLDVLRSNIKVPSCQHLLVVAPRGRGKTMLLVRAEAELKTNPEFSGHLLPVRLMEESYEIFDLASFWLEVLFHLARATGEFNPSMASELLATHQALSAQSMDQAHHERARAAVLDASDRLDLRIVLMIENLQSLIRSADEDLGWRLRETLQSEPQIMLVASATSQFEALVDANQPFFELFRTINLEPLNSVECQRLWHAVSGESIREQEIRPLQILTGGNPRLLVISARFAQHRSLTQLMEELVTLVDENTEYFRGHLEVLPRSERRVYISVLDLWQPSSTGEIARRARMDVRAVSTMLARLIERGAVRASDAQSGNKRLYAATEPLFSIYYKLRRERDEAAVVENLIIFMLAFYETDRFGRLLDNLIPEAQIRPSILRGIDRALRRDLYDQGFAARKKQQLLQDASQAAKQEHQLTVERRLCEDIISSLEERDFRRAIALAEGFVQSGQLRLSNSPDELEIFLECVKADAWLQLGDTQKVIEIGRAAASRFGGCDEEGILMKLARTQVLLVNSLLLSGELDEALVSAKNLVARFGTLSDPWFEEHVALVRFSVARAERRRGNRERANEILNGTIERYAGSASEQVRQLVARAHIEKTGYLGNSEPALTELDAVILLVDDIETDRAKSLKATALLLRGMILGALGGHESEVESYQEAIRCLEDSDQDAPGMIRVLILYNKGMSQADAGDVEGLAEAHRQLHSVLDACSAELKPLAKWFDDCLRCLSLSKEKNPLAMEAFGLVYATQTSEDRIWIQAVIRIVANLIRDGFAETAILSVLESDPEKSRSLAPLIIAIRLYLKQVVNVPAELLELARDVQAKFGGSVREADNSS